MARRLTLPPVQPFSNLRGLCNDHLKSPRVYITYVDCDSDAVLVESEAELAESVRCGRKSESAVRLHVAASLSASSTGASRWERRHAAGGHAAALCMSRAALDGTAVPKHPDSPTSKRPEVCISREALAGTAVPPPVPPGASWFGHHHRAMRWGMGMGRAYPPPPPPPSGLPPPPASVVGMMGGCQVVAELPTDVLERVDGVAFSVLTNPAFPTDVVAAVRAYVAMRSAGTEAVNVNGARQQAYFALHRAGMALLTRGDSTAALPLLEAASGMAPRYPPARYNVGCVRALCGDALGALEALREAVALGWHKARHMEEDPDLVSLRGNAAFAAIVASIRSARPRWGAPFHHRGVGVTVGPPPSATEAATVATEAAAPAQSPAEPPPAASLEAAAVAAAAAASDDVVVVEAADAEPAAISPPAAPTAAAVAPAGAAVCVSRRAVAAGQLGAMGFTDAAAVDTALAACGDSVEEAVALLLARA